MKKRIITTLLVAVLGLSSSITAFAAPKTMPDGTKFDAEYYAETYQDVKAAFGNDEEALYNHYVNYGKAEGRKPYAEEVKSPVEGATLVYSYETWGMAAKTYRVEQYSNGIWISKAIEGVEFCDPKYIILRTDFSDQLLDKDGNGIDDRDPYNSCGYTDLNHNCVADGAPTYQGYVSEEEHFPFRSCRHGIVNGSNICQRSECQDYRARAREVRIQ